MSTSVETVESSQADHAIADDQGLSTANVDQTAVLSGAEVVVPANIYRPTTERPIFKLSVHLIDTYKYINKVYEDHIGHIYE